MSQGASAASVRREVLLVAALLGALLSLDGALRIFGHYLSGNLAHIRSIPAIVAAQTAPANPGESVLVLGNSLTNNGVDAARLGELIAISRIAKVTPDATSFWDWQCVLDNQVIEPAAQYPFVVLGFAWHQLSDNSQAYPSRLGAFFCRLSDLRRPGAIGLRNSGDIGEFITAKLFRTYAIRDTLRNRALAALIPDYQQFTQEGNARAGETGGGLPAERYTYASLESLAARLRENGSRLVVVAMPVRESYALDPGLTALADAGSIHLFDYRTLTGVGPGSFEDSMHLTRGGQRVLTAQLAADLRTRLKGAE